MPTLSLSLPTIHVSLCPSMGAAPLPLPLPLRSRPPPRTRMISSRITDPNRSLLIPPARTCGSRFGWSGSGGIRTRRTRISAVVVDVGAADPVPAEITWQIVVGALAGITPFVVAGIEFSKRIIAQRKCGVCEGSGLVLLKDGYYARCPGCGGFLPWQSWKRFFTG